MCIRDRPWQEWQNTKIYPLRIDGVSYTPTSEIGLIINKNGRLQVPYEDFTVFKDKVVFKNPIGAADLIHIRTVEYVAPSYGSGAKAIAKVDDLGQIQALIPKDGGSKYRLDFNPKVTISHDKGNTATAKSLIGGIKDINLLDGGQGYSSYNPPIPVVVGPGDSNGTIAKLSLTVNDETGMVDSLTIENSGSGYNFIPAISFKNPAGATIGAPTIDGEGRVNIGSIEVLTMGSGYSNPPIVYIDPAPDGGINAQALSKINQDLSLIHI